MTKIRFRIPRIMSARVARWPRVRKSASVALPALGVLSFVAGQPSKTDYVGANFDVTASGGRDFDLTYRSTAVELLEELPTDTNTRFRLLGGENPTLSDGKLSNEARARLIAEVGSIQMLPSSIKGSPITQELIREINRASEVRGQRDWVYMGDAEEARIADAQRFAFQKIAARPGDRVFLLGARPENPLAAQTLRAAGVPVVVARTPHEIDDAIYTIVKGETPSRAAMRRAILCGSFGLSGLLLVPTFAGFIRRRRAQAAAAAAAQSHTEELAKIEARVAQERERAAEIAAAEARLAAERERVTFVARPLRLRATLDAGAISVTRTLRPGTADHILIASETARLVDESREVDLRIPRDFLHQPEIAARIYALGDTILRAENVGLAPLVVAGQRVSAGTSVEFRVGGMVLFGALAAVTFERAEEDAPDADASPASLNGFSLLGGAR